MADKGGALWVIDADIRDYFGSINHDKLLLLVKQRITDRRALKLIKGWLKAGVLENGQYSESTLGAPQGGVISPLLSNIYLNYFDICWNKRFGHLGELVRYADDFVILCKRKAQAEEALKVVKRIMDKLEFVFCKRNFLTFAKIFPQAPVGKFYVNPSNFSSKISYV